MKRSVAILGPTPSFIEWAIAHDCPLRDLDVDPIDLPSKSFRQLRSIREMGLGRIENRVFEDFCVHSDVVPQPDQDGSQIESARGFPCGEVYSISGSAESIQNNCDNCAANALAQLKPHAWAGCYGWTPVSWRDSNGSTLVTGLADHVERSLNQMNATDQRRYRSSFMTTGPMWFGLWTSPILSGEKIRFLNQILAPAFEQLESAPEMPAVSTSSIGNCESGSLRAAMQLCEQNELSLHVRLVPHGVSDGNKWELERHCPTCKAPIQSEVEQPFQCECCGATGILNRVAARKVLGNRPYLNLARLMGVDATREFLARYHARSHDS